MKQKILILAFPRMEMNPHYLASSMKNARASRKRDSRIGNGRTRCKIRKTLFFGRACQRSHHLAWPPLSNSFCQLSAYRFKACLPALPPSPHIALQGEKTGMQQDVQVRSNTTRCTCGHTSPEASEHPISFPFSPPLQKLGSFKGRIRAAKMSTSLLQAAERKKSVRVFH